MQTNLTEVMGEKLVLENGSKNKNHSSTLRRRFYFKLLGTDEMTLFEGYYWRENGTKDLFEHICQRHGGEPSDWEVIYAGKIFPYRVPAESIHDFFEGRLESRGRL